MLKVNYIPEGPSAWVVIHPSNMTIGSANHPPTYDPQLFLRMTDGKVEYDFRALFQSIEKGEFSWARVDAHLNSMLPFSGFVFCPGLKDYPTAVHFTSKHYMAISAPYKRNQSDTCSLWHVPKNRKQMYGSHLFNVCDHCKSLYQQLEALRKRHEKFSPRTRQKWKHASSKRPLKYCSPSTGIYIYIYIYKLQCILIMLSSLCVCAHLRALETTCNTKMHSQCIAVHSTELCCYV